MATKVADNVRVLRTAKGWTQSECDEHADLCRGHTYAIEGGIRVPSSETLEKLSEAFGVSMDALWKRDLTKRARRSA